MWGMVDFKKCRDPSNKGDDFEMREIVKPLYRLCNLNPSAALYEVNGSGIKVDLQL